MKIYVDNENFVESIKAMKSQAFGEERNFVVLYDKLNSKNKKLLESLDLPRESLEIVTKIPKNVPSKYKHQITVEKEEKPDIRLALKHTFRKDYDREQVLKELEKFQSRHLLAWLSSTSMTCPELAKRMSELEKYTYSKFFRELVAYNLEDISCIPVWRRRE